MPDPATAFIGRLRSRALGGLPAFTLTLALALMFALVLAGCGGGGGDTPQGQPQPQLPTLQAQSGNQTTLSGGSVVFSVDAQGATRFQWEKLENATWVAIPGANGASLTVSGATPAQSGTQYRVVVSNDAGSVTSNAFTLTVQAPIEAPRVTTQPEDKIVVEGSSVTLSVAASGPTLSYAWQLSSDSGLTWLPIPGATAATLVLPNLTPADSGKRYRAVVSNPAGFVESQSALLTVTAAAVPPSIATQPADQTANPGQAVSFIVVATGTNLTYQWQSSSDGVAWAALPGATTATLTIGSAAAGDDGKRFRVLVANGTGAQVTSAAARLTVSAVVVVPPQVTTGPADQTVNAGQNATFAVAVSGSAPAIRWQQSSDGGATWADIAGQAGSGATLTLPGVGAADHGRRVRVVASNSAGTSTSGMARLTVVTAPQLSAALPLASAKIVGQSVTFTITASATGATPAIQWERSAAGSGPWTPIPGAAAASYTLAAVDIADDGARYRAKASTSAGQQVSEPATLGVTWGSVEPSTDLTRLESYGGGGDGGTDGGGDGAGSDGGGGLGKTVGALFEVHRLADGALVGRALTHPGTGLVKIKAGPGTAPILITLSGNGNARYYDEGQVARGVDKLQAMMPFAAGQVLHALADRLDENLGVSPLTEAAYRYAINHFVVDPAAVASGSEPLRTSATLIELRRLAPEDIRKANAVILEEINRKLPEIYRLESIKALPTPVDGASAESLLQKSRYGRLQAVTGGLAAAAGLFDIDTGLPALRLVEQLARDLTDGVIDGHALDGSRVDDKLLYDPVRLPVDLSAGANQQALLNGRQTLYPDVPAITDVGEQWTDDEATGCPRTRDLVSLRKDASVKLVRTSYSPPRAKPPLCAQTSSTASEENFARGVSQLHSNGRQGFLLMTNGTVQGWGEAQCGMLGGRYVETKVLDRPQPIDTLGKLTSMAVGINAVAVRNSAGQVLTFGSDSSGELGLGTSFTPDLQCQPATATKPLPTVLTPRVVMGKMASVHVVRGRSFYAIDDAGTLYGWGSGEGIAFAEDSARPRYAPGRVASLGRIQAVGGTYDATFALDGKGQVWGWGSNQGGGLGDGAGARVLPAVVRTISERVLDIAGDGQHQAIALLADGRVLGWGPAIGAGAPRQPAVIEGLPRIHSIRVGNSVDAAIYLLGADGSVYKLDGMRQPFVPVAVKALFE